MVLYGEMPGNYRENCFCLNGTLYNSVKKWTYTEMPT